MDIRAFLIDLDRKDWSKLLAYWKPPLPQDLTLWFVNRFGDVFFVASDGTVHWLTVGNGTVSQLAPSREVFAQLLDRRENAQVWLRIALVEECRKAGIALGVDECYGFKIPPRLLGKYEVSNLLPTNIYSHYSWLSHLIKNDEIYWTGE